VVIAARNFSAAAKLALIPEWPLASASAFCFGWKSLGRGKLFDPLFARAALVVEGDDILGASRHVGDDEADAPL
jgi:hypothetical protein